MCNSVANAFKVILVASHMKAFFFFGVVFGLVDCDKLPDHFTDNCYLNMTDLPQI